MASIPLPALHVEQPTQQNALSLLTAVQDYKQKQALLPGQIQAQQNSNIATQQENQIRAQQISNQKAATAAMQEWDGKDMNALPGLMLKHGADAQTVMSTKSAILKQQQDFLNLTKDQQAIQANKTNLLLGSLTAASQQPDDKLADALSSAIQDHVQAGNLDPQHAQLGQQLATALKNGQIDAKTARDQLSLFEKSLMGQKELQDQAVKQSETSKNTAQAASDTANTNKINAEMKFYQAQGLAPGVPLDAQEAASWLKQNPGKTPADFMKMKAGLTASANATAQAGLLSDAAKQMAAQNYAQTGQLPAGMRSPGMSAGILNKAASGPDGIPNVAANKAIYHADTGSLASIQKNFDNVTAFENTAGKNLDTFLQQANKVVDSGSPWINKPLRTLSANMIGSEDQAAFNAARTTAITEIAKVLSSANAGSGVLSDSARHEVEGLIGPNATLKQIISASNILKQDMGNRHQSYQEQINTIKGRMGASQPVATNNQVAAAPSLQVGQKVTLKNGQTVTIKAVHPDGTFDAD